MDPGLEIPAVMSDEKPVSISSCRHHFPLLHERVNGKQLVYLDNAATSQKPQIVIDTMTRYYQSENSNIHRGVHYLSERATRAYEKARDRVREFLNAKHREEIILVRNTTEGINLVAQAYGRQNVKEGDEVLISAMEHHSNIVPWQILCEEKHAALRVIPMNDDGELLLDEYEHLLTPRTKIVALAHVSNALGTINPVKRMIAAAHKQGIPVILDVHLLVEDREHRDRAELAALEVLVHHVGAVVPQEHAHLHVGKPVQASFCLAQDLVLGEMVLHQ